MRSLALAAILAFLVQGRASAQDDPFEPGEDGDAPAPMEAPAAATVKQAPAKPAKVAKPTKKSASRASTKTASAAKSTSEKLAPLRYQRKPRKGPKLLGAVVPEERLRATPPPKPSGNLHLFTLATHESLKINIYNEDGSYNIEALQAASHMLRCKRTGAEKEIEPRLLAVLSMIYDHFGERRIEIVSGYRNQRRMTSYHFKASASDIRIEGVKPPKIRDFADSLDAGGMGVGLYPRAGFVHVDIRPLPSYRWIDYAKADGESPDKKPPRGWKRKKLQS